VSVLHAPEIFLPHLAHIADRLRQITVEIHSRVGGGAGILWAPDLVVTNAHVVRTTPVGVRLADDRRCDASIVAADSRVDLALLRIPRAGLAPAVLGDANGLRVGAVVVALGHPLGQRRSLTAGVVHAVAPAGSASRRFIQADVRLAPGNSGGPLADPEGRVVGINTMVAGPLALAIPIDEVRRFVAASPVGAT
jgi:serine protease Do